MKKIYSAASLPEAYMLRDALRAAGIGAEVFNENAQGAVGEIPFTHAWPEVWILDESDMARAREMVREYEKPPPTGTRNCQACGEENPAGFELCWHCGADLP
jgi:hypothetical protein